MSRPTSLAEMLDEIYGCSLHVINKVVWESAHRLFQFVSVASHPLRVKELAELLAFDFKAGPIPEFHEDWRLEDPVDAVLSALLHFACHCLWWKIDQERHSILSLFSEIIPDVPPLC